MEGVGGELKIKFIIDLSHNNYSTLHVSSKDKIFVGDMTKHVVNMWSTSLMKI